MQNTEAWHQELAGACLALQGPQCIDANLKLGLTSDEMARQLLP